jgi:chromosome segregation ATPase
MSERKVVGRNVVIAVGIIAIILLVSLVGAIANYTSIINNKDSTIQTKESQIQTLTNQKSQLQTWLDGNETLLNQTQMWLDGNKTLLSQTQTWLTGNLTLINTLNTQITNLQDQISGLNSQISSLNAQITDLQNQVTDLQNQIDTLKAPKLIKVHLMSDDVRHVYPWDPDHHLHVYGYICNIGTNTAYNSKIHVVAYQSGVIAIDTYITLGTISGESWTSVDSDIYYSGSELTGWTLTLEWTTS